MDCCGASAGAGASTGAERSRQHVLLRGFQSPRQHWIGPRYGATSPSTLQFPVRRNGKAGRLVLPLGNDMLLHPRRLQVLLDADESDRDLWQCGDLLHLMQPTQLPW